MWKIKANNWFRKKVITLTSYAMQSLISSVSLLSEPGEKVALFFFASEEGGERLQLILNNIYYVFLWTYEKCCSSSRC